MDEGLLYVGLSIVLLGFIGVMLPYTHMSEFFHDMQGLAGFITAMGVLLSVLAVFKDGLPIVTSRLKAAVGIGLTIIVAEIIILVLV
jgi:hypothetical protein|tara:strand:+ start:1216 stop:1476 length:261 start_codon:yes stop_codon:yes gene_type:complete